jgi:hypothetical protein
MPGMRFDLDIGGQVGVEAELDITSGDVGADPPYAVSLTFPDAISTGVPITVVSSLEIRGKGKKIKAPINEPSNSPILIGTFCPRHLENMAIVLRKPTNEYFQYLFEPWDYTRTKLVRNSQIHLRYMYATGLRRHYSTRSFRSTGLSSRLNLPAMAGIYQPTSQKNSTSL